ncbi:MAG: DUF748 domain-containing protein, partial [Xanthomonadales bacterium]
MNPENAPAPKPENRSTNAWLSPRRFRFWAIVAVLSYTLGGFFLAPVLVEKLAVDGVRDSMDRELVIGKVRINPFVLSADIENLELRDTDGEALFALGHFRANFQLSSLFRWAWTFREIRFDEPHLLFERFSSGDDRVTRLLADIERLDTAPEPSEPEPSALPRLLIWDLQVNEGTADFRDDVPAEPVTVNAGPVTVDIRELNTLPDQAGQQHVEVRFGDNSAIIWQGSLALAPLASEGTLALQNMALDQARKYLDGVVDLASFAARLSVRTKYRVAETADGALAVELTDLETDLEDVSVTGFEPAEPILDIEAIRTRGGQLAYPEQRVDIGEIDISGLAANLQLDRDGSPRILQLMAPAPEPGATPAEGGDEPAEPWLITAGALRLDTARIGLEDRAVEPAATLTVADLDVSLSGIDNRANTAMALSLAARLEGGGAFGIEGDLTALPAVVFRGRTSLDAVPLALAQPYVEPLARVAIDGGALGAELEVALDDTGGVRADGSIGIDDLQISDTVDNLPLLSWTRLGIEQFRADTAAARAEISRIELKEPYGRIQVKADRSTNLSELVVADTAATAEEPAPVDESAPGPEQSEWTFVVSLIDFENGGMDFSDLSLPLPFEVRIGDLNGSVTTIDSSSVEPAAVRLEGQVGDYGLARIDGKLSVFDPLASTDITMEFRNLLMSDLSPYSIEFAGRQIDEGKLNLDLEYVIDDSQLAGQNAIVVSDLVLGAEVESPNAVSLPLDLAVALLKDSNGVI